MKFVHYTIEELVEGPETLHPFYREVNRFTGIHSEELAKAELLKSPANHHLFKTEIERTELIRPPCTGTENTTETPTVKS